MEGGHSIEVRNLVKDFKVLHDSYSLKGLFLFGGGRKRELRQVLRGISFDVGRGESIGLIGRNGCGKSTTLKLLSEIIYPTSGTIEKRGRVSSLLELGAGFHPDMSGRENIYINASIFGLSRKEIDRRLDGIIAFSELGSYICNPVRTYSSGMYMRLAFSVAISVDADILLVDEILSVGDSAFQKKCFAKIQEIKAAGTTIVLVSHSMDQVNEVCDRAIWLNDGLIAAEGPCREVTARYRAFIDSQAEGQA
ncbi:MAG: ABC transporter ATP-binding protein [Treponema sp.]|nr:ABC transporter ATP-binding protein [Treponema sp.]